MPSPSDSLDGAWQVIEENGSSGILSEAGCEPVLDENFVNRNEQDEEIPAELQD